MVDIENASKVEPRNPPIAQWVANGEAGTYIGRFNEVKGFENGQGLLLDRCVSVSRSGDLK